MANRVRTRQPVHPGRVFKQDVMEPLELSVSAAAKHLGVSRKHLSLFVNEKVGCSTDLAQRLAKATGTSTQSWLDMQTAHDVWEADRNPSDEIRGIEPFNSGAEL